MLQQFRTLILPIILLLSVNSNALAAMDKSTLERIQSRGQLILGTSGNMPSMTQRGADGTLSGFDIDIALAMANLMEVELVINQLPFTDLIPAIEAGKVDVVISNMTITSKRNLQVAFVGPYLNSGKCVVSKDESLAQADQTSDAQLENTKLAVLEGSTSEAIARQLFTGVTVVPVEDFSEVAQMIERDEIGGLLTDFPICKAMILENPDADFVALFSLLTYEPIGIALPANDAQFINWTQNFLHRLEGTDTLQALKEKWFGPGSAQ
jgi:polar amino acid transport system substrate-binding protein